MIKGEFDPYNHNRPTVTGVVQIMVYDPQRDRLTLTLRVPG